MAHNGHHQDCDDQTIKSATIYCSDDCPLLQWSEQVKQPVATL